MKPKYMTGIAVSRQCGRRLTSTVARSRGRRFGRDSRSFGNGLLDKSNRLCLHRRRRCYRLNRIGRLVCRGYRRCFIGFISLLDNAQIEYRVAAVAQVGEKVFQHVSVRTASLQIHQLLLAAAHNSPLVVKHPHRGMVENRQHLVAPLHLRGGHLLPQHIPGNAFGMVLNQRSRDIPLVYQIVFQLFGTALGQLCVGLLTSIGRSVGTNHEFLYPIVFQSLFHRI